MSTQEIDLDLLEQTALGLDRVGAEFSSSGCSADGYDVGADRVREALDGLGDNWEIHRRELLEDINNAMGLVKGALKAYNELDRDLEQALQPSGPSCGPGVQAQ